MMDFHILIVISCVFLASMCSLLFINRFFRRKTFEEVIAEKKALSEKINVQHKTAVKKPKKLQQLKKELKREKKQRQKEQQKDTTEQEDSDAPSDQPSVEDDLPGPGLSKTHVEFEPDPEVLTYNSEIPKHTSNAEKEVSAANPKEKKSKKDKKHAKAGILVNKNESIAVKENSVSEEQLNHFETKHPKDVVELKKQEKEKKEDKERKEEKEKKEEKQQANVSTKKEKNAKKEKQVVEKAAVEPPVEVAVAHVTKELKQQEEKPRQPSPKNQSGASNKAKQQHKKEKKENAANKEIVIALDKLSDNDTIGVSLLMNLFRRAELNRSEIQILIDYLLNKQQDTPASHAEWSDDICQKLKRQLLEKERALTEEQEASIGIQAKLRELRTEINAERAQMNANIKAYTEKLQLKDQDITGLNQELQALNEKITVERQQFQAKLVREKQAGSADLMAQLQLMQGELAHKDKCLAELQCMVNVSRQAIQEAQQKNDIIQTQEQQIHALEQQRDELEQVSNNRIFELEQTKVLETENAEQKVEILNLQNALESIKVDLAQARQNFENVNADLAHSRDSELEDRDIEIQTLQAKNSELSQELDVICSKTEENTKEQSGLQAKLDALEAHLSEKDEELTEFQLQNSDLQEQLAAVKANAKKNAAHQNELRALVESLQGEIVAKQKHQQELEALVEALRSDVSGKHKQLQETEQHKAEQFASREKELLQQLQEQKEKNNELRMKNWKLIEALQNAETTVKQNKTLTSDNASLVQQQQLLAATQKSSASATANTAVDSPKDQLQIRELFQRLYPDAVKASAGAALSVSFDQWMEQVLSTHLKQSISKLNANNNNNTTSSSSSSKSTQLNSSSTNHNSTHNSHNNNQLLNSEATNNSNSRINNNASSNSDSSNSSSDTVEVQKLHTQNAQLRAQVDELTKLVTKTSNTLSELEGRAREQDEHWRSIVRSKDEEIYSLQHSNGDQDI